MKYRGAEELENWRVGELGELENWRIGELGKVGGVRGEGGLREREREMRWVVEVGGVWVGRERGVGGGGRWGGSGVEVGWKKGFFGALRVCGFGDAGIGNRE